MLTTMVNKEYLLYMESGTVQTQFHISNERHNEISQWYIMTRFLHKNEIKQTY